MDKTIINPNAPRIFQQTLLKFGGLKATEAATVPQNPPPQNPPPQMPGQFNIHNPQVSLPPSPSAIQSQPTSAQTLRSNSAPGTPAVRNLAPSQPSYYQPNPIRTATSAQPLIIQRPTLNQAVMTQRSTIPSMGSVVCVGGGQSRILAGAVPNRTVQNIQLSNRQQPLYGMPGFTSPPMTQSPHISNLSAYVNSNNTSHSYPQTLGHIPTSQSYYNTSQAYYNAHYPNQSSNVQNSGRNTGLNPGSRQTGNPTQVADNSYNYNLGDPTNYHQEGPQINTYSNMQRMEAQPPSAHASSNNEERQGASTHVPEPVILLSHLRGTNTQNQIQTDSQTGQFMSQERQSQTYHQQPPPSRNQVLPRRPRGNLPGSCPGDCDLPNCEAKANSNGMTTLPSQSSSNTAHQQSLPIAQSNQQLGQDALHSQNNSDADRGSASSNTCFFQSPKIEFSVDTFIQFTLHYDISVFKKGLPYSLIIFQLF